MSGLLACKSLLLELFDLGEFLETKKACTFILFSQNIIIDDDDLSD